MNLSSLAVGIFVGSVALAACATEQDLGARPKPDSELGSDPGTGSADPSASEAGTTPTGLGADGGGDGDGGADGGTQTLGCPPGAVEKTASGCASPGNVRTRTCAADGQWGPYSSCAPGTPTPTKLQWSSANPFGYPIYLSAVWGADPAHLWAVAQDPSATIFRFDGSVWTNFQPAGRSLNAVHGTGNLDAWAVGDKGYVLHWNGSAWLAPALAPQTVEDLNAVWAVSPSDVWISGDQSHFHWNGTAWSTVPVSGGGRCIWASGANDVWLGPRHWDGANWSTPTSMLPTSMWGSGPSDIWAVGAFGYTAHWNGASWAVQSTGSSIGFVGVAGTASGMRLALGHYGDLGTWQGGAWSFKKIGSTQSQFGSVWLAQDGTDAWAVGFNTIYRGRP